MVTTRKTAMPASTTEPTPVGTDFKSAANAAIFKATQQLGVDTKSRYKVQRAFGYIAMQHAMTVVRQHCRESACPMACRLGALEHG